MEKIYRTYNIVPQEANTLILVPDVKNYLQIDVVGDDAMVERLTTTAFDLILMEYDVISVTSDVTEDILNSNYEFTLKFKPVVKDTINVVKVETDGSTTPITAKVVGGDYHTKVILTGKYAPAHIRVTYEAGFGTNGATINNPLFNIIRQGVMQTVGTLYQDRENNTLGSIMEIPSSTRNMLDSILNINSIR